MIVGHEAVRAAALERLGLRGAPAFQTVCDAVGHLGAVQADSIAVVARSHHLTLRHRVQNYRPEQLWNALRQRELLEYYVHGNCFVPMEEFPYLRHCMQRFPTHGYPWLRGAIPKYREVMDRVHQKIQDEGPLASRDFADPGHRSGGWWNWKPAKVALDLLWWMGRIAVVDRSGFERVYDVVERAIPSRYVSQSVDTEEVWRHFLTKAIDCLTIGALSDIKNYFAFHLYALDKGQSERKTLAEKVDVLLREDAVVKIDVQGSSKPHYALPNHLSVLEKAVAPPGRRDQAWFLSPFDNIVWDRNRARRLFGVEVKLEAYRPRAQRKFGYYEMPILWDDRIIGRLDPKVTRETKTLTLENCELRLAGTVRSDALDAVREELLRFAAFHGCERVELSRQAKDSSRLEI